MNLTPQQIAADCTTAQRRALFVLWISQSPVPTGGLDLALQINAERHDCAAPRWPGRTLRALESRGLVRSFFVNVEHDGTMYCDWVHYLAPIGKLVARYCYSDGGCANG